MAEPVDVTIPIKTESAATLGDAADRDDFAGSEPLNDFEDAISVAGVVFQETGGVTRVRDALIWREGNNLKAKDPAHGVVNLLDSAGGTDTKEVKVSSDDTTPGFLEDKVAAGPAIDLKTLSPAGNEKLEVTVGYRRSFLLMGA